MRAELSGGLAGGVWRTDSGVRASCKWGHAGGGGVCLLT